VTVKDSAVRAVQGDMSVAMVRDETATDQPTLLRLARAGDGDAFASLVRPYDDGLRTLAYRLLGDRDRMDDALQEAYVRAFRALPRFRGDSGLATWLYRVVYNVCQDELRRLSRLHVVSLEAIAEPADHSDFAEAIMLRTGLEDALAELAPEDRAAVLLVDAQGFDYRAAAEILDVPEGTIASRLNRARTSLRRALEIEREGDPGP
jgi:RNA polymerase sigma-70 factor, ECF subfamily